MRLFNYTIVLFISLSAQSWAYEGKSLPEKVSKEIHKEFDVNPDTLIKVDNEFGNLNVTTWDQNKVVFDITITVEGKNKSKIQEKLEDINIIFKSSSSLISAKTDIEKDNWRSWFKWGNDQQYEINYTVKMPKKNNVDLSNDYGSIALNYLEGKATISCDYGKMVIGELMAPNNALSFDYTSNSTIDYFGGGTITADYSRFSVIEAENVTLNADYTSSKFETLKTLNFAADYGKVQVDNAQVINGSGDYVSLRFGTLSEALEVSTDYGVIRCTNISPSVKKVNINSNYTGIKLGVDPQWAFQHKIELEYSGLSSALPLTHKIERKESNEKYYEGYHLNANAKNTLTVESDYGGVKIYNAKEY